jgi:hypothetical protein
MTFVLAPGTYAGSMSTYDGPLYKGKPSGNVLSSNQSFPVTIAAGSANAVSVTLDGVPASLVALPASGNAVIGLGGAFEVAGSNATGRIDVIAADPDGNLILGPGAPTFSVTQPGGGFSVAVVGGVLKITSPTSYAAGTWPFKISAMTPACAGGHCDFSESAGFDPMLAIATGSGNQVFVVPTRLKGSSYLAQLYNGVNGPTDVKFDSHADVFVANGSGNNVIEYAPPYVNHPSVTISSGVSAPDAIAIGPDNTLAVDNSGTGRVTVYAPPYTGNPVTIPVIAYSLAFDGNGNLWVGTVGSVLRYPPPYSSSDVTVTDKVSLPGSIAFDSSNTLYVDNVGTGDVDGYKGPSYSFGSLWTTSAYPGLQSLAIDNSNGSIASCDKGAAQFFSSDLEPQNSIASYAGSPCMLTFDRNDLLWVLNLSYGYVDGYDTHNFDAHVQQLSGYGPVNAVAAYPGPANS